MNKMLRSFFFYEITIYCRNDGLLLEGIVLEACVLWVFLLLSSLRNFHHFDDFFSVGRRLKFILQRALFLRLEFFYLENESLDYVNISTEFLVKICDSCWWSVELDDERCPGSMYDSVFAGFIGKISEAEIFDFPEEAASVKDCFCCSSKGGDHFRLKWELKEIKFKVETCDLQQFAFAQRNQRWI